MLMVNFRKVIYTFLGQDNMISNAFLLIIMVEIAHLEMIGDSQETVLRFF